MNQNSHLRALPASAARPGTFERLESSVRSYCRSIPALFERAEGSHLIDRQGRRYLDFLSGAGSMNYGHNHPVLAEALVDYIRDGGVAHSLDMHTAAKARFLEALEARILMPRKLDYRVQFTGPTGANGVEAAIKLARKVTGREGIVAFTNAFHGVTLGALSLTGNQHHRGAAGVSMPGVLRAPFDGYLGANVDTLDFLARALDDPSSGFGHPAAVIVETVQGEGGLNAARLEWLQRLQALCHEHDILLIADDIQAGCGRTGTFFSFEPAGLNPDLVVLSKSLSGFGLPLAVLLIDPRLDQWKPGEHNGTFRGNNHAFVTATAALDHFWSSSDFSVGVVRRSQTVRARLARIANEAAVPLALRGRGLMSGLACPDGELAAAVCRAAYRRGMVIETSGAHDEVVKCLPALNIDDELLSEGLDLLEESFRMAVKS
ncbi:MAG: diaminobutyrate--2-oxoglutarate transaminase [Steroidobacteraceae bacterium]